MVGWLFGIVALIGWELFWMHPYSSFVDDVGLFGNCEVVVDEIQADGGSEYFCRLLYFKYINSYIL